MLHKAEALSIVGRKDIIELAHLKSREGKIIKELLSSWLSSAQDQFADESEALALLKHGSTYTLTLNDILLQKHS